MYAVHRYIICLIGMDVLYGDVLSSSIAVPKGGVPLAVCSYSYVPRRSNSSVYRFVGALRLF